MTLSIAPIVPTTLAQAATLDLALQPGMVVTAQVLKLLDANLVRIAIANLTLDVATTTALQPGTTLQLAVAQTKTGLSLTPVLPDPSAAATQDEVATLRGGAVILDDIPLAPSARSSVAVPVLTPLEARAVAVAAQTAATQQSGLSPLFANLTSVLASGSLPQPVLLAAAQLLALRQPLDQAFTGADIKAALTSSGLLSDSLRVASAATPKSAPASHGLPDLKAALIVLRHTLSTWLGPTAEAIAQPAKPLATPENPLRAAMAALPSAPAQAALGDNIRADQLHLARLLLGAAPAEIATQLVGGDDDGRSAPAPASPSLPSQRAPLPPPFRDALPAAQAVATASLAFESEPKTIAQQLIADTEGALARQTLLQIASLPDQLSASRGEATQPRWNFEIPFVTPQGTAMAQFEIARDGGHDAEVAKRVWRARFSIDIEPAGPVHALISFSGDTTSVKMWAERPATAATLRAGVPQLGQSLGRAALKTGDIVIADGAPTRAHGPRAGHFLNRAS